MERLQPNSITLAIYKKKCYNNKNNKTVISMENSPNIPHAGSPELPRVFSLAETGEVAAHTAQETKQKMEKVSVALRMLESQKCAKELHERVTKEVVAYVDSFLATDAGRKLSVQMSAARDMRALAPCLMEFLSRLERDVPSLRFDQPGWDGNELAGAFTGFGEAYIDPARAPQFGCDGEASIVAAALRRLQERGGLGREWEFHPQSTTDWFGERFGSHTALMVYAGPRRPGSNPAAVLDAWLTAPGEGVRLFQGEGRGAVEEWGKGMRAFVEEETKQRETFITSFRPDGGWGAMERFLQTWFDENPSERIPYHHNESPTGTRGHDYMLFRFMADPSSPLRPHISPQYFASLRARFAFALPEHAAAIRRCNTLADLQPHIGVYFRTYYPDFPGIRARFPER
jgi:hypothetical protein